MQFAAPLETVRRTLGCIFGRDVRDGIERLDYVPNMGTLEHRMRVISRKTLKDFWGKHADAEQALKAWFHEAKVARWESFSDIRARYGNADNLPGNRVIFNIKGNTYRLIVRVHYRTGIVFVRFIGTHAEYDRIDATTI